MNPGRLETVNTVSSVKAWRATAGHRKVMGIGSCEQGTGAGPHQEQQPFRKESHSQQLPA